MKPGQFFTNLDYLDWVLNPDRRGFSTKMREVLGVTKSAVSLWRKGNEPHKPNLDRFSKVLSVLISQKYNLNIQLTPEQLCRGNIKQIIEEQKKQIKYPEHNDHNQMIREKNYVDNKYEEELEKNGELLRLKYVKDPNTHEALRVFMTSLEWKLGKMRPDEIEFLVKFVKSYVPSNADPTIRQFIILINWYREAIQPYK